jgi:DNA repair exonuclease SbcCD ATPase subunit
MRINGLRLTNFGRFRGDHELDLSAGVYAIVARHATDARRSNWSGKTTLLSAIRWTLFGALSDAWDSQDAVISTGEKEVGGDMELTDGTFISRTKRRGQSAQLKVIVPAPDGVHEISLAQDQAQSEIVARLGMGLVDFDNTVWMGQKAMSRLVRAAPAERTRVVVDWLNLGQLEQASELVARKLAACDSRLTLLAANVDRLAPALALDRPALSAAVVRAREDVERVKVEAAAVTQSQLALAEWTTQTNRLLGYKAAEAAVTELEARQPKPVDATMLEALRTGDLELQRLYGVADAEVRRLTALHGGEFDGTCPVTCSECPVRELVTGSKAAIAKALKLAKIAATDARNNWEANRVKLGTANETNRTWVRWSEELKAAIAKADALKELCPPVPMELEPVVEAGSMSVDEAVRVAVEAETDLDRYDAAKTEVDDLRSQIDRATRSQSVLRLALRILGKGGAQRQIATRVLGSIEQLANDLLHRSAVDLSVKIDYGRELQEIAAVCPCGRAFPRSAAVRICEQCAAPRGKKRDEKLYINLSTVSGAAEDLAGIAIQLAAARWRRLARGSQWSVVALDEPFGACDAYNRKALAQTLSVLAGDGFEQAFVVAHSDDVLEAVPNRLVITADGAWSKVEVG